MSLCAAEEVHIVHCYPIQFPQIFPALNIFPRVFPALKFSGSRISPVGFLAGICDYVEACMLQTV